MTSLIEITSPDAVREHDGSLLPVFDPQMLVRHAADAHWLALDSTHRVVARLSLWWNEVPSHAEHRLGVIGHFATRELEATRALLAKAAAELRAHGCTMAVGPMDGNTWRRYRFITERGPEPPFFLEPDNPNEWPQWFGTAGFLPLANYFSALNEDLSVEDSRIPRALERLEREGIRLRALQPQHFVEELRRIYAISIASFQNNFLYTPVSEAEFLVQYEPVSAHIRPELILLAECDGEPIGFVFGIPDLAQAARGQQVDTVIVKTVAVLPGRRLAGLGNVLVARCQQAARALGFRRAIHALMHESNNSRNLSAHYAKPFRRYTIFARDLEAASQ